MIVSLVNPHDVLQYPKSYNQGGGYDNSWLQGIRLPVTVDDDLSTKPKAKRQFGGFPTSSARSIRTRRSVPTSTSTAT